jgi:ABC-type multidrug transport system ATPase subunit
MPEGHMPMGSMVRTESLIKRFGSVEALRGLHIEIPQRSIYAFVGPNGADKTTAIKLHRNQSENPAIGNGMTGTVH